MLEKPAADGINKKRGKLSSPSKRRVLGLNYEHRTARLQSLLEAAVCARSGGLHVTFQKEGWAMRSLDFN